MHICSSVQEERFISIAWYKRGLMALQHRAYWLDDVKPIRYRKSRIKAKKLKEKSKWVIFTGATISLCNSNQSNRFLSIRRSHWLLHHQITCSDSASRALCQLTTAFAPQVSIEWCPSLFLPFSAASYTDQLPYRSATSLLAALHVALFPLSFARHRQPLAPPETSQRSLGCTVQRCVFRIHVVLGLTSRTLPVKWRLDSARDCCLEERWDQRL